MGIGASEPDEATQLMMEACGIVVVEDEGQGESQGDSPGDGSSKYERSRFGTGEPWNTIETELDGLRDLEQGWRDRAISSRAAARLDSQWDDVAGYMAENASVMSDAVTYRESDSTPTEEEYFATLSQDDALLRFNPNLDRIDIECGALMRTLP
jgi:hypothetical protein